MSQLTIKSLLKAKELMDNKNVEPTVFKIEAGSEVCQRLKKECENVSKQKIKSIDTFYGFPVVEDPELLPWEFRLVDKNDNILKIGLIKFGGSNDEEKN